MFGGLCFMVAGHMTVGVSEDKLMARVGVDGYGDAISKPHAMPMDFTGRPLKGFIWVTAEGVGNQRSVAAWVKRCLDFTSGLPER